jgi:hypothetical protein
MLGAPTNHYLLFSNKDENSAGEVEIIVCWNYPKQGKRYAGVLFIHSVDVKVWLW